MREIKVNTKYRHFKGTEVIVIAIAKDSETLKKVVVYAHVDTNETWVRPYDEFISPVDKDKYPEVEQEYRFEEII